MPERGKRATTGGGAKSRRTAKPAAKAKATAKKPAAPKRKTATRPKAKKPAAPKRKTATRPAMKPASRRVLDAAAHVPRERPLTDEERHAMTKVAETALSLLAAAPDLGSDAGAVVRGISAFVDAVREGRRAEPRTQDERLGLGVLWGEQLRAQAGWRWVHLSYPDGFASYALVPDDRAFACFPLNRIAEAARHGSTATNTTVPLFEAIRRGALPARRENGYLVIG